MGMESRLKCPICEETFDENDVRELEIHVDHHLATSLICPVCNLSFGMSTERPLRHMSRNILTTRKIHEVISLQLAEIGRSWILSEKRKKEKIYRLILTTIFYYKIVKKYCF